MRIQVHSLDGALNEGAIAVAAAVAGQASQDVEAIVARQVGRPPA